MRISFFVFWFFFFCLYSSSRAQDTDIWVYVNTNSSNSTDTGIYFAANNSGTTNSSNSTYQNSNNNTNSSDTVDDRNGSQNISSVHNGNGFFLCDVASCGSGCCYYPTTSFDRQCKNESLCYCQRITFPCGTSLVMSSSMTFAGYQACHSSTCPSGCCYYYHNLDYSDIFCQTSNCTCQTDPINCTKPKLYSNDQNNETTYLTNDSFNSNATNNSSNYINDSSKYMNINTNVTNNNHSNPEIIKQGYGGCSKNYCNSSCCYYVKKINVSIDLIDDPKVSLCQESSENCGIMIPGGYVYNQSNNECFFYDKPMSSKEFDYLCETPNCEVSDPSLCFSTDSSFGYSNCNTSSHCCKYSDVKNYISDINCLNSSCYSENFIHCLIESPDGNQKCNFSACPSGCCYYLDSFGYNDFNCVLNESCTCRNSSSCYQNSSHSIIIVDDYYKRCFCSSTCCHYNQRVMDDYCTTTACTCVNESICENLENARIIKVDNISDDYYWLGLTVFQVKTIFGGSGSYIFLSIMHNIFRSKYYDNLPFWAKFLVYIFEITYQIRKCLSKCLSCEKELSSNV